MKNKSSHLDDLRTETTLPSSSPRRHFQRSTPTSTSLSRSPSLSRRHPTSTIKPFTPQLSTPFIRMNFNSISQFSRNFKLNLSATMGGGEKEKEKETTGKYIRTAVISPKGQQGGKGKEKDKQKEKEKGKEKELANKVTELLEETIMRQQELNELTVEKENMWMELENERVRVGILEESNGKLLRESHELREKVKKLEQQKSVLEKQKIELNSKISHLQKTLSPSIPPSLSNMKQLYLQKQLLQLRHKLTQQRTSSQHLLQSQLKTLRQQLFNTQRLLENYRISNQCLLHKNETILKQLKSTPELVGLRAKYRKVLGEKEEMRKKMEGVKRENLGLMKENGGLVRELERVRGMVVGCGTGDESLNFSMISNFQ